MTSRRTQLLAAVLAVAALAAVGIIISQRLTASSPAAGASAGAALPTGYSDPVAAAGSVVSFEYTATSGGEATAKPATVYLPTGYDPADTVTRYDVAYLMHGGGGSERSWLGTPGNPTAIVRVLDHMIADDAINPLIVVAPTFDTGIGSFNENVEKFRIELTTDLIPAFESSHHTYASDVTPAGLTASRDHRAFGGFSMGSVTTWYMLENAMDYFAGFLPLSGDSWTAGQFGGRDNSAATAAALAAAVQRSGYSADDYVLYAATGTDDIAYPNMRAQIDAMNQLPDTFRFTNDGCSSGVATFHVTEGNDHDYSAATEYAFLGLPCLFPLSPGPLS